MGISDVKIIYTLGSDEKYCRAIEQDLMIKARKCFSVEGVNPNNVKHSEIENKDHRIRENIENFSDNCRKKASYIERASTLGYVSLDLANGLRDPGKDTETQKSITQHITNLSFTSMNSGIFGTDVDSLQTTIKCSQGELNIVEAQSAFNIGFNLKIKVLISDQEPKQILRSTGVKPSEGIKSLEIPINTLAEQVKSDEYKIGNPNQS